MVLFLQFLCLLTWFSSCNTYNNNFKSPFPLGLVVRLVSALRLILCCFILGVYHYIFTNDFLVIELGSLHLNFLYFYKYSFSLGLQIYTHICYFIALSDSCFSHSQISLIWEILTNFPLIVESPFLFRGSQTKTLVS